jgi:hypothetical protein
MGLASRLVEGAKVLIHPDMGMASSETHDDLARVALIYGMGSPSEGIAR